MSLNPDFEPLITSVTLTKKYKFVKNGAFEQDYAYLEISATDSEGSPAHIFVYQKEPFDSREEADEQNKAFFTAVCSPLDWQEMPIGTLNDNDYLMFRTSVANLIVRSEKEADYIYSEIQKDVKLLTDINKMLLDDPDFTESTTISS